MACRGLDCAPNTPPPPWGLCPAAWWAGRVYVGSYMDWATQKHALFCLCRHDRSFLYRRVHSWEAAGPPAAQRGPSWPFWQRTVWFRSASFPPRRFHSWFRSRCWLCTISAVYSPSKASPDSSNFRKNSFCPLTTWINLSQFNPKQSWPCFYVAIKKQCFFCERSSLKETQWLI